MIHFIKIEIREKGFDEYRSFAVFADSEEMMCYEIRGYGSTPALACADAWEKFKSEDRWHYVEDEWKWE